MALPISKQVPLLLKILTYDRNLGTKAGAELAIGIVKAALRDGILFLADAPARNVLVVSLDAAGHVLSVTVGRSSRDEAFDDSALRAAREERFSPALRDGVPVATTFSFTTHFRLDTP